MEVFYVHIINTLHHAVQQLIEGFLDLNLLKCLILMPLGLLRP